MALNIIKERKGMFKIKKILSLLILIALLFSLTACNNKNNPVQINYLAQLEEIEKYENKWVTFTGYMTMMSTSDGKLAYITSIPSQATPKFNEENFITDSIVIETDKRLTYTDAPLKITGKLTFGAFSSENGLNYYRKISDAIIEIIDKENIPENIKMYSDVLYNNHLYKLVNLINSLNYFINYESFETNIKDIKDNGINFFDYQEVIDSLKNNNNNKEFLELWNMAYNLTTETNMKIKEEKYEELKNLSEEFVKLQTKLFNFCCKMEITPE